MHNLFKSQRKQMFNSNQLIPNKSLSTCTNFKMEKLIKYLRTKGVIKSQEVYDAMMQVDRGDFSNSTYCYEDW